MKTLAALMMISVAVSVGTHDLRADDPDNDAALAAQKFRAAENAGGSGFYWVDSTTGQLWLADIGTMAWVYCGAPRRAVPAEIGTYVPRKNPSGEGVFILNTQTGQGWWCNGGEWKELGFPARTIQTEPE